MKHATGSAYRQALEERIREIHSEQNIRFVRLRKQVVFERFIARLIRYQPNHWVLKGGFALQLRLGMQARIPKDVDLLNTSSHSNIYNSLADAAKLDLTNWFFYKVERPEDTADNHPVGNCYLVRCFLDGWIVDNFHVDVDIWYIVQIHMIGFLLTRPLVLRVSKRPSCPATLIRSWV